MKIQSVEQLNDLLDLIGKQNVTGCTEALGDGVQIWVFQTPEEVNAESALNSEEKEFCLRHLASGEKWAGIFQHPQPKPLYIPGITYCPNHDPHGNRLSSGGNAESGSRH